MNVQLHKKMVRPWNGNKVFVYKYMNTKNSMVCKAMNLKDLSCLSFLHFIATETLDLPGILGTFKMVEHSYQDPPPPPPHTHSKPGRFRHFNI